eukprot:CCRYP_014995-RB/>CCRYP_014995-RB protein AED:0.21 eAED:0.21 QI:76/1/1/1/1/1/3/81/595
MTTSFWDDSSVGETLAFNQTTTSSSSWPEHDFDEETSCDRSTLINSLSNQAASSSFKVTRTLFIFACSLFVISASLSLGRSSTDFDYYDGSPNNDLFDQTTNSTATNEFHTPSDHSPLFPLQPSDVLGFAFAAFGLILAAGGGIGGGGMLVPIYILVMGFLPKHAIPLSNVTVFGGAVANTVINVRKRHPDADRPLIDWDLILVMEPPTLFGALLGANLNKILSETVIAVMLVILLTFTAYSTFKKALKMYRLETVELKKNAVELNEPLLNPYLNSEEEEVGITNDEDDDFEYEEFRLSRPASNYNGNNSGRNLRAIQLDSLNANSFFNLITSDDGEDSDSLTPEFGNPLQLQSIIDQERHVKKHNVTLLISMFLVILSVNILKGGGGYPSPIGISCGSIAFWMAQLLLLMFIVMISLMARKRLINDTRRKMDAGYRYLKEDIRWNKKSTVVYPLVSSIAGFCAGMFGIGGGIVKGPLMLAMGVHPSVASATSACMILFTSFTATTTFAVYGMLVRDYAVVCTILGIVCTAVGQSVMCRLVNKTNRNSYIAFSIGVVVLLSALLMTLQSVLHLMSDTVDEEFSSICASHLNGPQF